jgi:hypothetical protein
MQGRSDVCTIYHVPGRALMDMLSPSSARWVGTVYQLARDICPFAILSSTTRSVSCMTRLTTGRTHSSVHYFMFFIHMFYIILLISVPL